METPEILPLGADGLLVRFSDKLSEPANRAALAFKAAVDEDLPDGVTETASSLTSLFVRFRPDQVSRTALRAELEGRLGATHWHDAVLPAGRTRWHIPASFEGINAPALEEVAAMIGLSEDDAVRDLVQQSLRVLALGFAPGQPYLGLLPRRWDVPRQTEVTPKVPRGAVVVAVQQVIPFANAAPTGWRQIGRTAFRCFDASADPALPLKAGDEVQFQPVSATALAQLEGRLFGGADAEDLT